MRNTTYRLGAIIKYCWGAIISYWREAIICLLTLVACYLVLSAATWVTLLSGEGSSGGAQTAVTEASNNTDNAKQAGETDKQDKNDSLRDQCGGMIWLFFAERHHLGGVLTGFLVGVICLLPAVAYRRSLRKALLERRRLYALARRFQYGTGFRAFGFGFVICMTAAVLGFFFLLVNPKSETLVAARVVIHGLVLIATSSLSIWLIHIFDYQDVANKLRKLPAEGLKDSLIWVDRTRTERADARGRTDETENEREPWALDREHTRRETQVLLDLLRRQLNAYRRGSTDEDIVQFRKLESLVDEEVEQLQTIGIEPAIKKYGNVAALFHPDYLAHISHVYLKLSQLRALNMPPRRVQLLGRRWTMRGLESEYVVVHDISDLRPEYRERDFDFTSLVGQLDKLRKLAGPQVGQKMNDAIKKCIDSVLRLLSRDNEGDFDPKPIVEQLESLQQLAHAQIGDKMNDAIKKCIASVVDRFVEPKWRQRSLKKRATVTVAPDGSLMDIAIEEERLFNI